MCVVLAAQSSDDALFTMLTPGENLTFVFWSSDHKTIQPTVASMINITIAYLALRHTLTITDLA